MSGELLIDGEIYIKKRSELYRMPESEKDLIYELEFETSQKPSPDTVALLEILKQKEAEEGTEIYDGCEEFWISMIKQNEISLFEQPYYNFLPPRHLKYKDKKSLDEQFIRLIDFLKEARYIGRYFKRTAPVQKNDMVDDHYLVENKSIFVIYATDNLMLIRYTNYGETTYRMLSPEYLKDKKYYFYGKFTDRYRDKAKLYKDIHRQIMNNLRDKNNQKQK